MHKQQIELLTTMRKDLHAHPEISEHETATQERIINFLQKHTKAKISKIAKTGVLASFNSEVDGSTVMIRGDIDALPIQETNTFKHRSKVDGTSHKCGHDGHTTILLGLAIKLTEEPIKSGNVLLLFQPAEENGMGAQAVISDTKFKQQHIDYVFALHNLPGFPKHEIVVKENEFTANVKSIIIKLNGKTAHAAEPECGYNPATAITEILRYAEDNTHNEPKSPDFFLMTPIHVTLGEPAYGISAGYGEVHLTIRSWSTELMDKQCTALETFINEACEQHNLNDEISWTQVFHANINHPEAVDIVKTAAHKKQLTISNATNPFKWGEDFGLFTQQFKGAMFGLGSGENTPALHNPDYDYPDEITPTGVSIFHSIITELT